MGVPTGLYVKEKILKSFEFDKHYGETPSMWISNFNRQQPKVKYKSYLFSGNRCLILHRTIYSRWMQRHVARGSRLNYNLLDDFYVFE